MARQIEVRITAKDDKPIDGYVELILGMFALSGVLIRQKLSKRTTDNRTEIYITMTVNDAPLGHLGDDDIQDQGGDK